MKKKSQKKSHKTENFVISNEKSRFFEKKLKKLYKNLLTICNSTDIIKL